MNKLMNDLIREKIFGRIRQDGTNFNQSLNDVIRAYVRNREKISNSLLQRLNKKI